MKARLVLVVLAIAPGCRGGGSRDTLAVASVTPASGPDDLDLEVTIRGRGFTPLVVVSPDGADVAVRASFIISLDGVFLARVIPADPHTLRVTIPAGLSVGCKLVSVLAPGGQRADLARGYCVLARSADGADQQDGGDGRDEGGPELPDQDREPDGELEGDGPLDGDPAGDEPAGGDAPGAGDSAPEPEVLALAVDPIGDGSSFAFVVSFDGRLLLGPLADGSGAVSLALDGSDGRSLPFAFARDATGGNTHSNGSPAPYPSLGRRGCSANTADCGPDNEDGRGHLFSGVDSVGPYLIAGGARSGGDLDYVYLARPGADGLSFAYLDLSAVLGAQTRGLSAGIAHGGRVYLGFPDTGGARPYLVAALRLPTLPGLDAGGNGGGACLPQVHAACNLEARLLPGLDHSSPVALIDSLHVFGELLYAANRGGLARATTSTPLDADDYPSHWTDATPSTAAWSAHSGLGTTATYDLSPADKSIPALADFAGRLYLARNTTAGPQLWACQPDAVPAPAPASTLGCDPAEWELVAANAEGATDLCQFHNPANSHLTLLQASRQHLYLGFDNPSDGLVLLRSIGSGAPHVRADFEGQLGCDAAAHPTGCAGLGGNGLSSLGGGLTRIFAAVVVTQGEDDFLYLVVGNGSDPVRLLRLRG